MSLATHPLVTIPVLPGILTSLPAARQPSLVDDQHPLRAQVEQFIAQRFFEMHGARISSFMPLLVALFAEDGRILAAVGIRNAAADALFLEHYLDTSVEQAISSNAGRAMGVPQRNRIVEVGNLASIDRRASRKLFKMLSGLLHAENFEWAVFTGCSSLHRMFKILGIETVCLGRALQSRLPVDQQTWGDYYEDSPRVVAGKVSRGCTVFEQCPSSLSIRAAA
jgi:hypothetical protein